MKIILLVVVILIIYLVYEMSVVIHKIAISKKIVAKTTPYTLASEDRSVSVLVLGDSTAVGVGASTPEDSLPALFAKKVGATYLENHAVSGSEVLDLKKQIAQAELMDYDYILVQIGGNDIVARHEANQTANTLVAILQMLPNHAHLVILSCGNVGATILMPWFVRPYYHQFTLKYHDAFAPAVSSVGGIYVNLYDQPQNDPFIKNPELYLAADGFHPSNLGYKYWFERLQRAI